MFVSMLFICLIKFIACLRSCCAISVDGGYSNWGSYTSCSATCGGGEQVRTRQCNNPTPQYKGKDCKWIGPANETRACNTFYCPSELVTSGRDPFNQNSDRSDQEKWSTSKGGPVFSKLFQLDRTDPLSFGPKFPDILVEWIAPSVCCINCHCRDTGLESFILLHVYCQLKREIVVLNG